MGCANLSRLTSGAPRRRRTPNPPSSSAAARSASPAPAPAPARTPSPYGATQERKAKAQVSAVVLPEQPHTRLHVHDLDTASLQSVEQLLTSAADKRRAKAAPHASQHGSGLSGPGAVSGSSRVTAGGASWAQSGASTAARLYASSAGRAGAGTRR